MRLRYVLLSLRLRLHLLQEGYFSSGIHSEAVVKQIGWGKGEGETRARTQEGSGTKSPIIMRGNMACMRLTADRRSSAGLKNYVRT